MTHFYAVQITKATVLKCSVNTEAVIMCSQSHTCLYFYISTLFYNFYIVENVVFACFCDPVLLYLYSLPLLVLYLLMQ